jgi:hypothetical protein
MSTKHTDYGPEWLAQFADRLASNDQALEAGAFRQMAQQWNDEQAALHTAQAEASDLQRRLNRVGEIARAGAA